MIPNAILLIDFDSYRYLISFPIK